MGEAGWRLTGGSVATVIWFAVLTHFTDWNAALVFLAAVICGFLLAIIDLIFIVVFEAITGDS